MRDANVFVRCLDSKVAESADVFLSIYKFVAYSSEVRVLI